jgi:penicillin-binding protein 1A
MRNIPWIQKKTFGSNNIKPSRFTTSNQFKNTNYSRRRRSWFNFGSFSGLSWWWSSKLLWLVSIFIGWPILIALWWFYIVILSDLPNIEDLEKINSFSQASTVADRNGKDLYKIFEENRQYVTIDKISPTLQDAIVATEDQTFWDNAGVDFYGIAKAGIWCLFSSSQCRGASTITQQLIKNIYLSNERSIVRKLKEIVLALKLKSVLEKQVKQTDPTLKWSALQESVKKKVLELYLNYIFLGNNSYGAESASTNYFATGAQYLNILESAILAGIPQAPGRYNVYSNRDDVMWYLSVTDALTKEEIEIDNAWEKELYLKASTILSEEEIEGSDANSVLDYLKKALEFEYSYGSGSYTVQYKLWRKDEVLARMFDTKVITSEELKKAVIEWFNYEFKKSKIWLTAPHFVFWVKELLETPGNKYLWTFDPEILYKWGLTITTSLDLDIQQMAEKAVKDNIRWINGYGAANTSLIHLDSIKGDILAYVGSADFDNLTIKGQNDMVRAPVQPWSSIKPLWYALGFMKLPLTLDTQIYDINFKVADYDPQNADGKFNWPMPLRKALAYSRNIPAVKMYFAVGQENEFVKFAESMWVTSLKKDGNYGPSMAIGSAEMQMLELANMYAHLSAQGKPGVIDPILEIKAQDGTIIYKRTIEQQTQVIPSWVAYLLWKILSDPKNLPSDWVSRFTFPGISFAHKTGTSNIRTKDDKRMPKDGWLATYTPSKVTLFWAGNTTPKALNANAFWWWMNNATWKQFWWDLKKWGYLTDETVAETEVKKVTIAKNSGKLASQSTPKSYQINTLAYINTAPTQYDNGAREIQIDSLCYGKVSDLTPPEDIIPWYISQISSFMPNNMDLQNILNYAGSRQSTTDGSGAQSYSLFASEPTQICTERTWLSGDVLGSGDSLTGAKWWDQWIAGKLTIVKPANNASVSNNFALRYTASVKAPASALIIVNGNSGGNYEYTTDTINDTKTINIPWAKPGTTHSVILRITDALWTVTERAISVKIEWTDNRPPYILRPNTQVINNAWSYAVTLVFSDLDSSVKWWVVTQWGTQVASFEWSVASFSTTSTDPVWFSVSDFYDNIGEWSVEISQYIK